MNLSKQQIRSSLLFEFNKGTNASQAHRNLRKAFGQNVITVRSCQLWFQKFRNGDFNLEDEPRSGRPSVIDKKRLQNKILETPDITTRELEKEFKVAHGTIVNNLHQLGFVSKLMSDREEDRKKSLKASKEEVKVLDEEDIAFKQKQKKQQKALAEAAKEASERDSSHRWKKEKKKV